VSWAAGYDGANRTILWATTYTNQSVAVILTSRFLILTRDACINITLRYILNIIPPDNKGEESVYWNSEYSLAQVSVHSPIGQSQTLCTGPVV